MKPVLIYTPEEARRNAFAVNKITSALGAKLVTPDFDGEADFVINRTNDYKIAEKFESRGIRVFNSSEFSRIANNKQNCYDFMEKNSIAEVYTILAKCTSFFAFIMHKVKLS